MTTCGSLCIYCLHYTYRILAKIIIILTFGYLKKINNNLKITQYNNNGNVLTDIYRHLEG